MTEKELLEETRRHLDGYHMRKKSLDDIIDAQKEETTELKKEWSAFKKNAITILGSGLVALVGYGIWVGTIQSSIQFKPISTSADKNQ